MSDIKKIIVFVVSFLLLSFPAYAETPAEVYEQHLTYCEFNSFIEAQEICDRNYEILGFCYWYEDGKCCVEYDWRSTTELLYGMAEHKELEVAAEKILKETLTNSDSEYQIAHDVKKWLYNNVNYDYSAIKAHIWRTDYGQFAENVIFDGKAVCAGYADAFYLLCNMAGVEARLVHGEYNGMPHVWNAVKVEDSWYFVDLLKYGAFMYGTDWFSNHGYRWEENYLPVVIEKGSYKF